MFRGKAIRVTQLADGLAELAFDRVGEKINKFDGVTIAELHEAVGIIRSASGVRGLLVTSAKDVFIVGADIFEFGELFKKSSPDFAAYVRGTSAYITEAEDLPIPTVAAINATALGGGFEMALACDYRVMSATAKVGLPEVTLGIMPGFGGTVRLPRLIDLAAALDWLMIGKPCDAKAALALGAVDAVASPETLRDMAIDLLKEAVGNEPEWRARRIRCNGPVSGDAAAFADARVALAKLNPHIPAPRMILELVERCAGDGRDAALIDEAETASRIIKTEAAQALVQNFVNDQSIRKLGKAYTKIARKLERGAVLGAGIMGGGIAYTSAVRGTPVMMKDIDQKALDLGIGEASKLLANQVAAGRMDAAKAETVLAAITPQLGFDGFDKVDVVVEAIVENLGIKKKVLAEVEGLVRDDAILASNTSSLSIGELATALRRPENFVGMHFFNPVALMPLVEIIKGPKTSDVAAATVAGYAMAMGKTPIVVKDCPGFLVNRILIAYMCGFEKLVADGADFREIDRVMESFGWPMGPAFLMDVIGLDTGSHVLKIICDGFPDRLVRNHASVVDLLYAGGRLGQKNRLGFYRYEPDAKGRLKKLPAEDSAGLIAAVQPGGPRSFSDAEIVERLMLPMIVEAATSLEEGIADTPAEIDTALLLGLGFPRHVGGPLKYADWLGFGKVIERIDHYAALGPLYQPIAALRARSASGKSFYGS